MYKVQKQHSCHTLSSGCVLDPLRSVRLRVGGGTDVETSEGEGGGRRVRGGTDVETSEEEGRGVGVVQEKGVEGHQGVPWWRSVQGKEWNV